MSMSMKKMRSYKRDYVNEQTELGTWSKIGPSKYERRTGEVVKKDGNNWGVYESGERVKLLKSLFEAMRQTNKTY